MNRLVPSCFRISTLWPPTPESFWTKSMPHGLPESTLSSWTLYVIPSAVTLTTCASGGSVAVGPWLAPAEPDQQSGTGVADGSGLNLGSCQPVNVLTLPSGPTSGSSVPGSRMTNVSLDGARRNAMRSEIWM